MWVETESQKGILIGHQGRMIKAIGTAARKEIERELGRRACTSTSPSASAAPGAPTTPSSTASASPRFRVNVRSRVAGGIVDVSSRR